MSLGIYEIPHDDDAICVDVIEVKKKDTCVAILTPLGVFGMKEEDFLKKLLTPAL